MSKIIRLIIILLFFASSCDQNVESYYDNGKVKTSYKYIEEKDNYLYTEFYPNGKVRYKCEFLLDKKQGKEFYYDSLGEEMG